MNPNEGRNGDGGGSSSSFLALNISMASQITRTRTRTALLLSYRLAKFYIDYDSYGRTQHYGRATLTNHYVNSCLVIQYVDQTKPRAQRASAVYDLKTKVRKVSGEIEQVFFTFDRDHIRHFPASIIHPFERKGFSTKHYSAIVEARRLDRLSSSATVEF